MHFDFASDLFSYGVDLSVLMAPPTLTDAQARDAVSVAQRFESTCKALSDSWRLTAAGVVGAHGYMHVAEPLKDLLQRLAGRIHDSRCACDDWRTCANKTSVELRRQIAEAWGLGEGASR